jgi:peroxiredoxin
MESNNDPKNSQWVDDRLASLNSEEAGEPDSSRAWALLQQKQNAEIARGRRRAWTLAATAAAFTCVLAFPMTRAFASRCVSACVEESSRFSLLLASLSIRGGLPPSTQIETSRKPAPDFTLRDAAGKAVRLSDFRGQVVLLNFWATWCGPCKVEIPWFVEFEKKYGPRDFTVLGVSFDDDGWQTVTPYVEAKRMNYPVLLGNDALDKLYGGIGALPTTLILDKAGRIAVTHVGLCSRSDYEAEIKALLTEQ